MKWRRRPICNEKRKACKLVAQVTVQREEEQQITQRLSTPSEKSSSNRIV